MTDYERALMSLDESKINNLFAAYQQTKAPAFSGGKKFDSSTMGIATPQDVQFAKRAKEKVAPIAQAVYEGTLADPVERLASWSALADPNTPETVRKAAQDYVAPLPVTPEGRINEEGLARAAGPILGITTYHGTPHKFDKFSTSAVGTGEGAQAYGYGMYFADNKDVAAWYRDKLASTELTYKGDKYLRGAYFADKILSDMGIEDDVRGVYGQAANIAAQDKVVGRNKNTYTNEVQRSVYDYVQENIQTPNARLYTTELTPHPDEFLLWDRPLSEQSEKVKAALIKAQQEKLGMKHDAIPHNTTIRGSMAYERFSGKLGSDRAASEYLNSLGIRGIKYLDNPSRGAGEGTYNYVMFNPAEEAIITHENGKRIPGAVEEAYRKLRDPKSKALFEERYPELKGE